MISSIFYNGDGSTRIFPVTFKVNGEDYVRVYVDNVEVVDRTKYDIINNSIVFTSDDIPAVGTDNIKIYVATSSSELGDLGAPLTDITNVSNNLAEIVAVSAQVIPNLPEILLADNNATIATSQATIATTKASEASASATSASSSATTATTKASEANASAISASNSATSASNSATTATTKANEASASASSALTSSNNASTSEDNALLYANNAKGYADSINPSLLVSSTEYSTHLSVPTAYHIYNGQLALSNTVTTAGFSTTLYTGNGTTQSITTGVDMDTQWGNDASEKFGGLVWTKCRSATGNNLLVDTVRGNTKSIATDLTVVEGTNASYLTAFSSTGFSLGSSGNNTNTATYASWNFQTTHRVSGTTNHGKAFTCHYNPFTGFTIVKYEGSGLAGHEIPHFLGRKLGFVTVKNLSAVADWVVNTSVSMGLSLNSTVQQSSGNNIYDIGTNEWSTDTAVRFGFTYSTTNASTNQYILYGWANSYFDEKNTLIGNYEIGVYQGTGAAGNKVTTKGKPAWVMIKRLDSTGNWDIYDNMRASGDAQLLANASTAETAINNLDFNSDGFTWTVNAGASENASGGQYLYIVVYDNDSGSGKSKYPRATDTSTLNLNAHVPFANGIDATGSKVSIAYKNETVTLSNSLVQGKNYIALLNNGSYVATAIKPSYGLINPSSGDFFNIDTQKWYSNSNVEITPRNYLDCIVYADQNGQPEYVEQLPKTTYFDKVSIQNGFDLNQKWVDVKSNRAVGVTYTNTTGKPIQVVAGVSASNVNAYGQFIVDGLTVNTSQTYATGTVYLSPLTFTVPNNSTYKYTISGATSIIHSWIELR